MGEVNWLFIKGTVVQLLKSKMKTDLLATVKKVERSKIKLELWVNRDMITKVK